MTDEHAKRVGARASPHRNATSTSDDESATTVHGGGKQFAKDVGDPDTDEVARQTEGSGKQFAWDTETEPDETELPDDHASGAGEQFIPGPDGR